MDNEIAKCDICGAKADYTFSTSVDFRTHHICRKCSELSGEEFKKLNPHQRRGVMGARILTDDSDDD